MSLEDDILTTVKAMLHNNQASPVAYAGRIATYDAATRQAVVVIDGASGQTACVVPDHVLATPGKRVIIMRVRDTMHIVCQLGNRLLHLPEYTGSNPAGTIPGDLWYRTDTGAMMINSNGTIRMVTAV